MIKFFRKIRYNLIETGKTGKYFKYAIGEIVLVVIGILIALQINNWNEERKTNLKSQVYIDQIINDITKDTLNINELIEIAKVDSNSISNYFSFFNQGNIPIDKLIDSSVNTNNYYFRYIPVNNTFLDMQASGNSNLLNENQRNALIQLVSQQEQLIIIIEKLISKSHFESGERDKFLGYPDNFYQKLGTSVNENNKTNWLIHQHLKFKSNLDLYHFMELRGNRIKEKSLKTIKILKGELIND
ncbi:DUF6090 family protein [Flavobacteriaceae bacterium S0862]|nr:DUF6090 family protein [Flavobacteriaceae bacterium S0862]